MNWAVIITLVKELGLGTIIFTAIIFVVGTIYLTIVVNNWFRDLREDRNNFKKFIDDVGGKLNSIYDAFVQYGFETNPAFGKSSPLTLTDLGKKISKEINGQDFAENEAKKIFEKVKSMSAYEVQEFCLHYIHNDYKPDDDYLSTLKDTAFYNGMSLRGTKDVLAVELRDALLKLAGKGI
ncbi:MAG: hypothetical protein OXF46_11150 [Rhodobacteraceae bacterium]|nr:hypothetical protein [Paracoccaceae bacterium]